MSGILVPFLDGMDNEFCGKSWNGSSLMSTLDALSPEEASSEATWEGYSAWSIALHCAKCKRIVANDLGASTPDWPYPEELWFPSPVDASAAIWARDRELLRALHDISMGALRAMPESMLAEVMPTWKSPWGTALAWLVTHDAFHGAQIRSMGLPSLKAKRHE